MTTENKFDTSAFIAGYMDTYGQEPSYAVVVDAAVEQLKAELEKVQQDKASNDSDYLKLSAENNTLKSKLEIAKKGLEFYADDFAWLYNEIKKSDCEEIKAHYVNKRPIPKGLFFEAGGKTARQALKEINEG